jgi:transposase
VREATLWRVLLGVEKSVVVEEIDFDENQELLIGHVRLRAGRRGRCGRCERRSPAFDRGEGRRWWRGLDLGTIRVVLEADAPRVRCPVHGVTVAAVPWARHAAGHTRAFDEQVAWLATQCSKSAVTQLMRIAWRTVGSILSRTWVEVEAAHDRFAGLARIGIDEISYKRGHKYLMVVVDHDTGRLVWAAPGRDRATLERFFETLQASGQASGEDRCGLISQVSADGADWIARVVGQRCHNAELCLDPFHVVAWATKALDEVRRGEWNAARRGQPRIRRGRTAHATGVARDLQRSRFALWKNPENLTVRQAAKLDWIAKTSPVLYRAYLLKEGLRLIFQLTREEAAPALDAWISWARRCRIPAFVQLQRTITTSREAILAAIDHGLSNGRIESVNTKIRLITRIAFGFRSPDALIALAMLTLGGHRPTLPGRT